MTPIAKVRTAALALLTLALLSGGAARVAVQTPPDLFDGQVLHRIDLYLNSEDWRDIQANAASRSYYPATLKWGTVVARNVGIRSDGASERDRRKPRLRVDTAWYVSGLTFLGLQSITLDNLGDDASGIRRAVTTRFYKRMGLTAPRAAHAVLYVNNTFAGLYLIVESIESTDTSSSLKLTAVRNFLGEPIVQNRESLGLLDANGPIERGLRALPRTYLDALLASADEADRRDRSANASGWLEAEVNRQRRLIAETVESDSFKPWTSEEVQQGLDRVAWFGRERAAFVRCEVARRLLPPGVGCRRTGPPAVDVSQPVVLAAAAPTLQLSTPLTGAMTNIALGRPYTLAPRPNYAFSSDEGDGVQLTDGLYSAGIPLWTRLTSVGWGFVAPVTIVIDLGVVQPIAGVSFSTAAGTAGVEWPRSIFVAVSDDGRRFFSAGDLRALPVGAAPASPGYSAFRFVTRDLTTHGRYLALIVDPTGPYIFSDEVEVFAGDPAWLRSPLTGDSTTDLQQFFADAHMRVSIQRRLTTDLVAARTALEASKVSASLRERSARELSIAESEIGPVPLRPSQSFRAVLPLNATHARIFAVHGLLRQASGVPALSAWVVNPWDFVRPTDPPAVDRSGALLIAAMAGETRSGALNFSNSTDRAMTVRLRLDLPDSPQPPDLHMYEVVWTDTRELIPVADALVPLPDGAASFVIPAGMTRQLWFSFTPAATSVTGTSRGALEATADTGVRVDVPIELEVLPGRFPERPRLHVGGWDYTDTDKIYGLTATNREALVRQLQQLKVDSPWATSGAMPAGRYDSLGRLAVPPDTSTFDAWVSKWRGANRYLVFVDSPDTLGNIAVTDDRFPTAAGQWIAFWVAHAATLGIQPSQLMLLLVDEPRSRSQDERIVAWARAIKAREPAVRIWENPTYTNPAEARPQLLDVSDVLAMARSLMLLQGAPFVDFYRQRQARGQALEIYGASGPARLLDPYSYYRLQAWVCADVGASGSLFWSFADDARGSSWNEYATTAVPYSPFFLSSDGVTSSKHVEAIREGVEDFEYLAMLRDRVNELVRTDPNHAGLAEARSLLEGAVTLVLQAPGASEMQWVPAKDRTAAERVRLAVADLIGVLGY